MSSEHKGQDRSLASAHEWLHEAALELGVDPDSIRPLVKDLLDLTRDVAHGPSRPAAPLTAFLVGLAAGGPGDAGDPDDVVKRVRERIRAIEGLLAEHARQRGEDSPPR